MYEYKAKIIYVADGDTVDAIVDLGFDSFRKIRLRIKDIDTPETWRPSTEAERFHGEKASDRARTLLLGKDVILNTELKKGKWRRYIASITMSDGRDYATVMKEEGFAKKESYDGRKEI